MPIKLSCTQENLRSALSSLERVVGKQSTLPILSNILLTTIKGQLQLSATNLEIGVITVIGAKIESEGMITLPAKLLINFIHNLALDQIVSMEQVGTQVVLQSGNFTVKINGLDGKDFPIIPETKNTTPFSLEAALFCQGLQKTLFCVSLNESRPELTGVLLSLREGRLVLTATDSFRLAEWQMMDGVEGDSSVFEKSQNSIIIPAYALQEVLRVTTQESGRITISIEDSQIFFQVGSTRIVSRLINGKYPEYQAIMPKQYVTEIILPQSDFQRALKMAHSFSVYSSNEITFCLSAETNQLEIQSQSLGIGEQVSKIPFEGNLMETMQLIFNPRYLLEGAATLSGNTVVLSLNSPATPVRLSSSDSNQTMYTYIVMPIRK